MTDPARQATDAAPQLPALQERIAALRAPAARVDPVRLRYLEALATRAALQAEPVRALLCDKLAVAVAQCERRCESEPSPRRSKPVQGACAPLAALNRSIRAASSPADAGQGGTAAGELAGARRFRRAWLGTRTLAQVRQAAARKPANAGPLNSHALVLQSLAIMARVSPDYLRRFALHVQALQWLEQSGVPAGPSAKAGARARKAPRRKEGRA